MRLVESVLGPDCVRQGPVILGHNPAADQIEFDAKLAHPRGEEGISFIRVIRGTITNWGKKESRGCISFYGRLSTGGIASAVVTTWEKQIP